MYKLLIADDEIWLRERLKLTIDWKSLGIDEVLIACDGDEALSIALWEKPDIILTDIRMPGMSGLEFIHRLKEAGGKSKILILSGYAEFEFAKTAMEYGVHDYLLKPIEDEELIEKISKCLNEIYEYEEKERDKEAQNSIIQISKPLLKEKVIRNFLLGVNPSDSSFNAFSLLDIGPDDENYICFVASIDDYGIKTNGVDKTAEFMEEIVSVINISTKSLGSLDYLFLASGEIVFLFSYDEDTSELVDTLVKALDQAREAIAKTGHTITIGVGEVCYELKQIRTSFNEAREALRYRVYMGKNRVYRIDRVEHVPRATGKGISSKVDILANYIKTGDEENIHNASETLIHEINEEDTANSPINLKLLYVEIVSSIERALSISRGNIKELTSFNLKFLERLNYLQTKEELVELIREVISLTLAIINKYQDSRKRKIVEAAIQYIEENYAENITLSTLANHFYLNAAYFCRIFKQETGDPVTKYLFKYRVGLAKKLLKNPMLRINEIAVMVGYSDVRYFVKIFKSITGVSPTQYREKVCIDE